MNRSKYFTIALTVLIALSSHSQAQTTQAVTDVDPLIAIGQLRAELTDSFNKGDVDRLLSHVDPNAVVTWQNGEVCHGPDEVRAYYNKMIKSDHPIVAKLTTDPVVEDRHIYGDWAVSAGNLHDAYMLNDGSTFTLNSHFTATIARRGDAWKIVSFHASVNAFDNPILSVVARKVGLWAGIGGAVAGVVLGLVISSLIRRKRTSP